MSQIDLGEPGQQAVAEPKKAWVDPQLQAFPMSEAENGSFHAGENDGITNDS